MRLSGLRLRDGLELVERMPVIRDASQSAVGSVGQPQSIFFLLFSFLPLYFFFVGVESSGILAIFFQI